jgi:class I lanthipeptide synthase
MTAPAALALRIADKLIPVEEIATGRPESTRLSLAHGLAGTALMHARFAALEPRFAAAATLHWDTAAQLGRARPPGRPGVFGERGGLAASLIYGLPMLPDPGPHLAKAATATAWLSHHAVALARAPHTACSSYDWAVLPVPASGTK